MTRWCHTAGFTQNELTTHLHILQNKTFSLIHVNILHLHLELYNFLIIFFLKPISCFNSSGIKTLDFSSWFLVFVWFTDQSLQSLLTSAARHKSSHWDAQILVSTGFVSESCVVSSVFQPWANSVWLSERWSFIKPSSLLLDYRIFNRGG